MSMSRIEGRQSILVSWILENTNFQFRDRNCKRDKHWRKNINVETEAEAEVKVKAKVKVKVKIAVVTRDR